MLEGDIVMPDDLPFNLNPENQDTPVIYPGSLADTTNLKKEIEGIEKDQVIRALKDNNCIQNRASKAWGITPPSVRVPVEEIRDKF